MKKQLLNRLLNQVTILTILVVLSVSNVCAQAPKAEWMSGGWGIGFRFRADDKRQMDSWDADILVNQVAAIPGVSYVILNLSDTAC